MDDKRKGGFKTYLFCLYSHGGCGNRLMQLPHGRPWSHFCFRRRHSPQLVVTRSARGVRTHTCISSGEVSRSGRAGRRSECEAAVVVEEGGR